MSKITKTTPESDSVQINLKLRITVPADKIPFNIDSFESEEHSEDYADRLLDLYMYIEENRGTAEALGYICDLALGQNSVFSMTLKTKNVE